MMEDLKRRLEFNNVAIQRQALNKLNEEVRKSLTTENKLTVSSSKSVAFKLLEEKCGATDTVVAKAACSVMVELVREGLAEFTAVQELFLNQVPNAKNLCGIVQGTTNLLLWQAAVMAGTKDGYMNPYTLRSPPHPFITILTNRPDSWILLGNQVTKICSIKDERIQGISIEILEPFLKFVFAEPLESPQYQPIKKCLQRELLALASQSEDSNLLRKITGFFANLLPCLQVKDVNSVGSMAMLILAVIDVCLVRVQETEKILRKLLTFLLDLCWEFQAHSLDISMVTRYLVRAAEKIPSALQSGENLISLGALLLKTEGEETVHLLATVMKIMDSLPENLCGLEVVSLVLPILQILSLPASEADTGCLNPAVSLSAKILKIIEEKIEKPGFMKAQDSPPVGHLSWLSYRNNNYSLLAQALGKDEQLATQWLHNLINSLPKLKIVPVQIAMIVSALFIKSPGKPWSDQSLRVLQSISKADPQQANYFLPLYIYQLNKNLKPEVKLSIMKAIPSIAQHKFCIPPVLRTIQTFGSTPRLKALSIQLLADLWKIQDRCFPYLLQAISEPASVVLTKEGVDEVKLAKVKAIRDVCLIRGEQHGSDVLSPLSDLLESSTSEVDSPVASLALEGLYHLCKAEVIDIVSTWSVVGSKLANDPRSIVQERICQLFSLLPELEVKTEEFEKLHQYAVASLWLLVHSDHHAVSVAAFRALSQFPTSSFKLSHIPDKIKIDIVRQAETIIARGDNPDLTVEDVITEVPGVCFTRLLGIIPSQVYEGYKDFLVEQVGSEVKNLPRGVYHRSVRRLETAPNQSKTLETLPLFLQQQYDKCKQPGLRPGLAAGLLFSYDPPVEVGRDGRPRKHYIITHSQNFLHMFNTLLHEVIIQPSDWQKMQQLPQAWVSFMDRLFTSAVEGRRAEIDLQLKKNLIGIEDAEEKQKVAWLWVRDQLTDKIKTASKESPNVQGNAILSLSGLVLASQRYWTDLDKEFQGQIDNVKEFQSQSHWATVVMDTLMSLMDVTFQPKGHILGLCQQRTKDDRMTSSFLAQASAVLALYQLTPVIINLDVNRIFGILEILIKWLPGQLEAPEAPVLQTAYGLGLGGLLERLFEEHFLDTCGSRETVQIWRALDKLEEACFTGREESCGCLLGLGLAVSSLCCDSKTEARAHVLSVLDKLQSCWQTSQPMDPAHEMMAVDFALISSVAFNSNIISSDRVLSTMSQVVASQSEARKSSGIAVAAGLLLYHLSEAGLSTVTDQQTLLHQTWTRSLNSEESSDQEKIAAMSGLLALIGSHRALTSTSGTMSLSLSGINVDEVVTVMRQVISMGDDLGLQNSAAWMLGQYYMSASSVTESRASVATSMSYLPESSFLRAVVDFLLDAGRKGPEAVPAPQVECCLRSLQVTQSLPPVNWAGILTPLMRINFSDEVKRLCLQVGITQSSSSTTAAVLVSSWVVPPLIHSLSAPCRSLLYDELPTFVASLSPTILKSLLDTLQNETGSSYLHGIYGLQKALKVADPPAAVACVLLDCLKQVYKTQRSLCLIDDQLFHLLAECLGSVVDEVFDDLTEDDFVEDNHFLSCFVRCYLLTKGRQPIALLNRCVDASLNNPESDTPELHALFYHTFWHISQSSAKSHGVLNKLQWLLELLGHTRNLATGAITLSDKVKDKKKVVEFAIRLAVAAISIWTSSSSGLVYNINPNYLMNTCPSFPDGHDLTLSRCPGSPLDFFPSYVSGLEGEPWSQILPKVLDWMAVMQRIHPELSPALSAAEIGLKHTSDFRQAAAWTDILQRYEAVAVS